MDRLFLLALVREIAAAVCGARVRTIRLEPDGSGLVLGLGGASTRGAQRQELVLHVSPGVAGLYLREPLLLRGSASPREANLAKLLASSTIVSAQSSELDRVTTVELEQTRLSGKKRRRALVLELVAARNSLFIIDVDSSRVVDLLTTGTARLAVGDRFRPLEPPPNAAPPAPNADELERRLAAAGNALERGPLLAATGWTPLLVKELLFLMNGDPKALAASFETLQDRLRAQRPVVYLDRKQHHKVVVSPLVLSSASATKPRPMETFPETFNAAMAEAVRRSVDAERARSAQARLGAAVRKRLKSLTALTRKLERQREELPEPATLRHEGEALLAGIGQAERVGDTSVRVPDPYHPEGHPIEIGVDPRMGIADNAQRLFRRSRKAERTEIELSRRLEELELQRTYAEGVGVSLDTAIGPDELDTIEREMDEQGLVTVRDKREVKGARDTPRKANRREGPGTRLPPRSYRTHRGNEILVGRSARSNAELTFRLARPDDLWFHASGMPGSHVVLKLSGSAVADDEEILEAAGFAAHFSKGRNDSHVEVMVTERRHVSKIKGAPPGLVRVERMRTVRVRPTPPPVSESNGHDPGAV